jgi:hypothetical protein
MEVKDKGERVMDEWMMDEIFCYWPKFPPLHRDLDFSSFVYLKCNLIVGWDGG